MTIDIDKLEAAAKAAAPGNWRAVLDDGGVQFGKAGGTCFAIAMPFRQETARFIVASQPAAILELIRRLRDAEAANKSAVEWWEEHKYDTTSDGDGGEWNVFDSPPDFVEKAIAAQGASHD